GTAGRHGPPPRPAHQHRRRRIPGDPGRAGPAREARGPPRPRVPGRLRPPQGRPGRRLLVAVSFAPDGRCGMMRTMGRTFRICLGIGIAAALAGAAAAQPADPPPPASLENHDVENWADTYLHTAGWTLLTHNLE